MCHGFCRIANVDLQDAEIRDALSRYPGLLWPVPILWDRAGISMLAGIL